MDSTRTKTILTFHQCARSLFYPTLIARHCRRMFRYKVILIKLQLFALFQRAFSTTIFTKDFANSIVLTKSCTFRLIKFFIKCTLFVQLFKASCN